MGRLVERLGQASVQDRIPDRAAILSDADVPIREHVLAGSTNLAAYFLQR